MRRIIVLILAGTTVLSLFDSYNLVGFLSATDLVIPFLLFFTVLHLLSVSSLNSDLLSMSAVGFVWTSSMLFGSTNVPIVTILRDVMPIIKGVATLIIFYYWIESYDDIKVVLVGLMISGCLAILFGYIDQTLPQYDDLFISKFGFRTRFSILGLNYTEGSTGVLRSLGSYGVYVSSASILVSSGFYLDRSNKKFILITYALGIILGLFAVELSQSRSNLVSFLLSQTFLLYFLLSKYTHKHGKSLFSILFSMCLAYLVYMLYTFSYSFSEYTIGLRLRQYSRAIEIYSNNLIMGSGIINSYNLNYDIHNSYLSVLMEGGSVGFLSFVSIFAYGTFVAGRAAIQTNANNVSGVTVCLVLVLIIEMSLFGSLGFTVVYIIAAIAASIGKITHRNTHLPARP